MALKDKALSHVRADSETAALLMEAASVVGRPLDGTLRYRLILKARACEGYQPETYQSQGRLMGIEHPRVSP
jgi:hypothetical protein